VKLIIYPGRGIFFFGHRILVLDGGSRKKTDQFRVRVVSLTRAALLCNICMDGCIPSQGKDF